MSSGKCSVNKCVPGYKQLTNGQLEKCRPKARQN